MNNTAICPVCGLPRLPSGLYNCTIELTTSTNTSYVSGTVGLPGYCYGIGPCGGTTLSTTTTPIDGRTAYFYLKSGTTPTTNPEPDELRWEDVEQQLNAFMAELNGEHHG